VIVKGDRIGMDWNGKPVRRDRIGRPVRRRRPAGLDRHPMDLPGGPTRVRNLRVRAVQADD
jgi:hypothetical protein